MFPGKWQIAGSNYGPTAILLPSFLATANYVMQFNSGAVE
jgi:hypothetical protein